jgi:signal transduction histidine kinase
VAVLGADGRRLGIIIQVTETTPFFLQSTVMNQALMMGSVRQHELTEEAERLNGELQRANDDLKQFAFAASHDLQEPLRMARLGLGGLDLEAVLLGGGREEALDAVGLPRSCFRNLG